MPKKTTSERLDQNHKFWNDSEEKLLENHVIPKPLKELEAVQSVFSEKEVLLDIKGQGAMTLSMQVPQPEKEINFFVVRNYLESIRQVQMFSYNPATIDYLLLWFYTGKSSYSCLQVMKRFTKLKKEQTEKLAKVNNLNSNAIASEFCKGLSKENQITNSLNYLRGEGWLPYAIGNSLVNPFIEEQQKTLVFVNFAKNMELNTRADDKVEGVALLNAIYSEGKLIDVQELLFSREDVNALLHFAIIDSEEDITSPNPEKYPMLSSTEYFANNFGAKYDAQNAVIPVRFVKNVENWTKAEQENYLNCLNNTLIYVNFGKQGLQDYEEWLTANNRENNAKAKDDFLIEKMRQATQTRQEEIKKEMDDLEKEDQTLENEKAKE